MMKLITKIRTCFCFNFANKLCVRLKFVLAFLASDINTNQVYIEQRHTQYIYNEYNISCTMLLDEYKWNENRKPQY